jgi:MoxR-like ATPase/predicted RNA-binding protein with PUA-like domain
MTTLQESLETILRTYLSARTEPFAAAHPTVRALKEAGRILDQSQPLKARHQVQTTASAGLGNWAAVPWIAHMDRRETGSTQHGVYGVWLFRKDMTGVYLTLNQGVTEPYNRLGTAGAREFLRARAKEIRNIAPEVKNDGFYIDDRIDLRADAGLGRKYESSTIAYKLYLAGQLPDDEALYHDVEVILRAYDKYLTKRPHEVPDRTKRYWVFQSNPKIYDLSAALRALSELSWNTTQHAAEMQVGDEVFLWQSGSEAGVQALATIVEPPKLRSMSTEERVFALESNRFDQNELRAVVRVRTVLQSPLLRRELMGIPGLSEMEILRQPQGTNFRVTDKEAEILASLIATPKTEIAPVRDMRRIRESFEQALHASNIRFGSRHSEVVGAFLASLATKPFVILTGLSGSGKTQLALRFGEWLGTDHLALIPVRPDWTGPEQLLGYEDALLQANGGKRGWHVPQALEFMLMAAQDPTHPYLLILDEMNLAHVERYFADVLSGMESGATVLPNLSIDDDGIWRQSDDDRRRVRFPDNLFVVGTVNVDETTYMFSPKVLDRANTIEFRVQSDEFDLLARKPITCAPGPDELVRGFLQLSRDEEWQHQRPVDGTGLFIKELATIHQLLSDGGFEFGHRVFYETIRFASIYCETLNASWKEALDQQILQKIMPRLHGSRRRLEPTLLALRQYTVDLTYSPADQKTDGKSIAPQLPRSYAKATRMIRVLQANQFASFAE